MEPEKPLADIPSKGSARTRKMFPSPARAIILAFLFWITAAYFFLPAVWKTLNRHNSALDDIPRISLTKQGIPGDPLNIAIVGSDEEILTAMLKAGWLPADTVTLRNCMRIAAGTVLSRSYENAPVSDLYVWNRKQDMAFQQQIGKNPRKRHHVRLWRSDHMDERHRPLWIGAATLDKSVGLSRTTTQITHHIDADVDTERNKLLDDLKRAGLVEKTEWIREFHTQLNGRNGSGDPWFTDGRLPLITLVPDSN